MKKTSLRMRALFASFAVSVLSMASCSLFQPPDSPSGNNQSAGEPSSSDPVPSSYLVSIVGETSSANPSLGGTFYGGDGPEKKELHIREMDIDVTLTPGFAETRVELVFWNPTERDVQGELLFDLPTGAIVTGYGLDVKDFMIPGVLVANPVANRAYQARVRESIDPGIAEVTRENSFKNRIYPIPAEGTRRVSLAFIAPVNDGLAYSLPLNTATPVGDFSVRVQQANSTRRAHVRTPDLDNIEVKERSGTTHITASDTNIEGFLEIEPNRLADQVIQRHPNGELFALSTLDLSDVDSHRNSPKSVRIYWDTSLSHQNQNTQEVAVISELVKQLSAAEIKLITAAGFDGHEAGAERYEVRALDADNLGEELDFTYEGGTNLEALLDSASDQEPADLCLLVSDGRTTLGGFPETRLSCPLVAISESSQTDRGFLELLAKRNQGRFIDLTALDDQNQTQQAVQRILSPGNDVQAVLVNGEDLTDKSEWHDDGVLLRIVTPVASANARIEIQTSGGTHRIPTSKLVEGAALGAWWAHQRISAMRAREVPQEARVAFARKYSVANDEAVFAVFELLDDYINNEIPLPKVSNNAIKTLGWEDYEALLADHEAEKLDAKNNRMEAVITAWAEQIDWYDNDLRSEPEPKESYRPTNERREFSPVQTGPVTVAEDEFFLDEIIVTGRKRAEESFEPAIGVTPWNPDRPYLEELAGLCGTEFRNTYFDLLPIYGDKPAFFLEVADSAYACGDRNVALKVAASALESEFSTVETQTAVAHRLLKFGYTNVAVDLFQKAANLDPLRPHPWRNLALAYASRARDDSRLPSERIADFEHALEHLNRIITQPQFAAYEGIELIALNEANLIVAELAALGEAEHGLDPRLVRLMDVDLRIVITWNRDAVDLDLRVTEPHGEEVYYEHQLSQYGGKLSNDMMNGYGPEEYLIEHAQVGSYKAKIDYFASDFLNPNGPVISQVEVFKNWGRENQSSATTYNEFLSETEEEYEIARITFEE